MSSPGSAFAHEGLPVSPPTPPVSRLAAAYRAVEHAFDVPFGAALNPLKHLGALGFMLFWLLVVSGVVLYILLDTSAEGAYRSINELELVPWMLGTALRGLHRYAADGFVVIMFAHIVREWMLGRFKTFRRVPWLTGIPLVALAFVCGIGGFWLNWDRLGQYSATATAEWLDTLPLLASPLARNFLGGVNLSNRLFTLFVFVHLGMPLLMVFGLWFHIQRISLAKVFPPRALALGTTASLLLLALVLPVHSQGPANLSAVPQDLQLDWILLFLHPLADQTSEVTAWVLVAAAFAVLVAIPLLPARKQAVAQVDPDNCSGCRRCFNDCPYSAITMVPHPNGRRGVELAVVDADLCASCGICVGSCPSSTPFRRAEKLQTGIDMPQWPINDLRERLLQGLEAMPGPRRYVVFGCDQGARANAAAAPDVLPFSMVCTGMLPPSFIEYALRGGADGVLVSGCREGGCEFRLGQRWTQQRLSGEREPHLRTSVPPESWHVVWADHGDEAALVQALDQLRARTGTPESPLPLESTP